MKTEQEQNVMLASKLHWGLSEGRPCGDDEKYPEKCGEGSPGDLGRRMQDTEKTMNRLRLLINNPANRNVRHILMKEFKDQKDEFLALKKLSEEVQRNRGI
jgi:hypothetical protein